MTKFFAIFFLLSMMVITACSNESVKTEPAKQSEASTSNEDQKTEPATTETDSNATTISDKLKSKKVLSDRVEILIPKDFEVMSEEMIAIKYPQGNPPTLVYTDNEGEVNIAFNHTTTPIEDSEIEQAKPTLKAGLESAYPDATWYRDEMTTINGKNVGVFELITPALDTNIYNLMFFTELDGQLLVATFNCTEELSDEWKPLAQQILQSYKVN
ncbi:MAG TPA: hypothetical protein GX497_07790 [Bacillus bacterium]|nr:hypothetical protein [Bacillus sp. (in: firmicutes)]